MYGVMPFLLHSYEMEGGEKREANVHGLTVQLLFQSLDLPRLLDQTDGFPVDVGVGPFGPIDSDACKQVRWACSWPLRRYRE